MISGIRCQPVELIRASTRQEVCIFIFICFCSIFNALALVYRPTTYYTNSRSLSSTSHPGPDRQNWTLSRPSEKRVDTMKDQIDVQAALESLLNGYDVTRVCVSSTSAVPLTQVLRCINDQ